MNQGDAQKLEKATEKQRRSNGKAMEKVKNDGTPKKAKENGGKDVTDATYSLLV